MIVMGLWIEVGIHTAQVYNFFSRRDADLQEIAHKDNSIISFKASEFAVFDICVFDICVFDICGKQTGRQIDRPSNYCNPFTHAC